MSTGLYYITSTIRVLNHNYSEVNTNRAAYIETFENVVSATISIEKTTIATDILLHLAETRTNK